MKEFDMFLLEETEQILLKKRLFSTIIGICFSVLFFFLIFGLLYFIPPDDWRVILCFVVISFVFLSISAIFYYQIKLLKQDISNNYKVLIIGELKGLFYHGKGNNRFCIDDERFTYHYFGSFRYKNGDKVIVHLAPKSRIVLNITKK